MLSYRHSFHAGNFADLLKHIVQVEILEYLRKKDAPFEYIDTHSGAGLYNLHSHESSKLQEFANGIGKINSEDFPELDSYFEVIQSFNKPNCFTHSLDFYPGSPLITQYFLRDYDRSWLFELHPKDFELLDNNLEKSRRIRAKQQDGFAGLNALLPPKSRRGFVLIDPSYEVKSDYDLVAREVISAHKKFSNGTYAIWYPVVQRQTINRLEKKLINSGIRNIQRFELGLHRDSSEHGMTSSGMIVINPPWTLFDKMSALLPKLAKVVTEEDKRFYKCDVLVEE